MPEHVSEMTTKGLIPATLLIDLNVTQAGSL